MQGWTEPGPATATAGAPGDQLVTVTVRYWAGAKAAAGVPTDTFPYAWPVSVGDVLADASRLHPALVPVVEVASLLVDGSKAASDRVLKDGAVLEVLPPFAGG